MPIKTALKFYHTPFIIFIIKKTQITTNSSGDVGKREFLGTADKTVKLVQLLWKSVRMLLKNTKNKANTCSSYTIPGCGLQRTHK